MEVLVSPADLVRLPDAVSRAALVTELAVFEPLSKRPLSLEALRPLFLSYLRKHRVRRPVYSRSSWSLDEFVLEFVSDKYLQLHGEKLSLSQNGVAKLKALVREAASEGLSVPA
jgi:hypothetical protein